MLSLLHFPWARALSPHRLWAQLHRHHRLLSAVSPRTSIGCGGGPPRLTSRASRARCGNARPPDLSPARHARARSSAPASCALRPVCRQSLPGHSSTAPLLLYARQNSASSASASSLARTRRAVADNSSAPVTSISPTPCVVLSESAD